MELCISALVTCMRFCVNHTKEANLQCVLISSEKWMVTFSQLISGKLIDNAMY
jgi:hypothetical protein